MSGENVKVRIPQGGDTLELRDGGTMAVYDPSYIQVANGLTGLLVAGQAFSCSLTVAAGAANVSEITIQLLDGTASAISRVMPMVVWLSDAATGAALTTTTASGAVAQKSGGTGVDLSALVSKKALLVLTNASGAYILSITDTAKTAFYVCAAPLCGYSAPEKGHTNVALATASYGA